MRKVGEIRAPSGISVEELVESYRRGGSFGAGRVAEAVDLVGDMFRDDDCTRFLGLAGAMVPAGMKAAVVELIEDGLVDVLVSTGANLSHDLLEEFGGHHYCGRHDSDDHELKERGISRIYDIYLPEECFEQFEDGVRNVLQDVPKDLSIKELLHEIGTRVSGDSVLGAAARNDVDVYCPAIQDSILGIQVWSNADTLGLTVDAFRDMEDIMDTGFGAENTGAILIGGGVPKNYILQTMMTVGEGFDYVTQLTTDTPANGGLSGATLEEAVSWGKIRGRGVTVYGDATITFPLIVSAAREDA